MILHTASEGVTLAKKLETESAQFYEDLAKRYDTCAEAFHAFAKENRRNIDDIQRTYYGVITDAIEGGFCFDLNEDNYALEVEVSRGASLAMALTKAVAMEQQIIKFYNDAAEQSRPLMADLPRAFDRVVRRRSERIPKLKSLLAGAR